MTKRSRIAQEAFKNNLNKRITNKKKTIYIKCVLLLIGIMFLIAINVFEFIYFRSNIKTNNNYNNQTKYST
jgi:hypothetical protein